MASERCPMTTPAPAINRQAAVMNSDMRIGPSCARNEF
jgi:hypothetical protein